MKRTRGMRLGCLVMFATACAVSGDVIILNNGSLLLGNISAMTPTSIELSLGAAGAATVAKTDVKQILLCPAAEQPDSYFKAGIRAERSGFIEDAKACYTKSAAVEPATAREAQSYESLLRVRQASAKTAKATSAPVSDIERRRAEALRLIAEGDKAMVSANMAATHRGSGVGRSDEFFGNWGVNLQAQAQAKIKTGEAMLAQIEKELHPSAPAVTPAPTLWEQIVSWMPMAGLGVVGLVVLRLMAHPFLGRD